MQKISCSRDGTVKLWDVPTQTSIATFATPGEPGTRSAVNECCVFAQDAAPVHQGAPDPREVGTEGKAIVTAGDDGMLRVFDMRISTSFISSSPFPPAHKGRLHGWKIMIKCILCEIRARRRRISYSVPFSLLFLSLHLFLWCFVGSRTELATFSAPAPEPSSGTAPNAFNCCTSAHLSGTGRTVVGGTESGHIVAWDLRAPTQPLRILFFPLSCFTLSHSSF